MPVPSNSVPENAIAITSLPYAAVIADVFLSPTDAAYPTSCDTTGFHPLWWTYTPPAGINYIAFIATGDGVAYFPQLSIFTGSVPGLTQYYLNEEQFFCGARGLNYWWTVPVVANTTYHIRFTDYDGTAPSNATCTVSFVSQPFTLAPPGSLVIPDDAPGFPALILTVLQDGALLQSPALPIGERGATLPGGELCGSVGQGPLGASAIAFYDATWGLVMTVTLPESPNAINANETNFYVAAGATLYKYSSVGVELDTWTPTSLTGTGSCVVNRAGTLAYYTTGSSGTAIRTWNLSTDVAGANLTTVVVGQSIFGNDGGTLANGTIWFPYRLASNLKDNHLRGYDAAGVLQFDYTVTTGTDKLNHASYYPGTGGADPESIWLWIYKAASSSIDIFRRINVADGSVVDEFEVAGAGLSGEPLVADAPFAVSNSCPFIVLRMALEPLNPPAGEAGSEEYGVATELPIRWVLRTPVLG